MSLYLKYRPKTLDEVRGNAEVVSALEGMLSDLDNCPHSFLLHGPTGCGKTTIGRIIADRLGCTGMDFREVDSADFRGIDTVREIRKQSQLKSLESPCRVWLIDECHKMTNDAQNALLKILEDTPKHIYFILCTTDPHKLLKTIQGRCSQFAVKPLSERDMFRLLRKVVKDEGHELPKDIYDQITQDSLGHPRNALQILDQVLRVEPDQRLEIAKQSAAEYSEAIELCRALIKGANWKEVRTILGGMKNQDPESARRNVMGYAQAILLKDDNERAGLVLEEMIEPFWNSGFPGLTYACYSITKN